MAEIDNPSMTLDEVTRTIVEFEADFWDAPKDRMGQIRHLALHLGKLQGKISTVCERWEHGLVPDETLLKTEVAPDLLYYAASISAILEIDLQDAFLNRLEQNKVRVSGWVNQRDSEGQKSTP